MWSQFELLLANFIGEPNSKDTNFILYVMMLINFDSILQYKHELTLYNYFLCYSNFNVNY